MKQDLRIDENLFAALALLVSRNNETYGASAVVNLQPEVALVCAKDERAPLVAEMLVRRGYNVSVAEDAATAVTRIRASETNIVVLDEEFSEAEDGAACVHRMINQLTLAERRRVFVVGLSHDVRTMDAHVAFVASLNLIVNTAELAALPDALERTRRTHQEIYGEYEKIVRLVMSSFK